MCWGWKCWNAKSRPAGPIWRFCASLSGAVKVQEDLVHLAFLVENLDTTMAALQRQGIRITDGPTTSSSGSRFIFIDAPDGYEVELIERPSGRAAARRADRVRPGEW